MLKTSDATLELALGPSWYAWNGVAPGEHTPVSRVTDVNPKVRPTGEELEIKKTFLEDNSQFQREDHDFLARPSEGYD